MNNDLISRKSLKEEINSTIAQATKAGIVVDADYLWSLLNYAIDNAPTVTLDKIQALMSDYLICRCEPKIPQGEWIERTERITLDTYYECSNCKELWTTIEGTPWQNMMNFCPNCGARMKGGAE